MRFGGRWREVEGAEWTVWRGGWGMDAAAEREAKELKKLKKKRKSESGGGKGTRVAVFVEGMLVLEVES